MIKIKGPNVVYEESRFGTDLAYQINIKELHGFNYQDYFEIENVGEDVFTLRGITVSCGCTTPTYEKDKEIKPGESYKVPFIFNVDKTRIEKETGMYTKYIYVKSDKEDEKPISIHLNCKIRLDEG